MDKVGANRITKQLLKALDMAELKTYKQKVRYVLEFVPQTRNSDGLLIAHYINHFHRHMVMENQNGDKCVPLKYFNELPPFETIRRCRQIIQNVNGDFIPTDEKVIKGRGIKEENWRNAEVREAENA